MKIKRNPGHGFRNPRVMVTEKQETVGSLRRIDKGQDIYIQFPNESPERWRTREKVFTDYKGYSWLRDGIPVKKIGGKWVYIPNPNPLRLCGKSNPKRRNPLPALGLISWLVLGGGAVLLTDFVIGKFRGKESAIGGLFASLGGIGRGMPYLAAAGAVAMSGKYLIPKEQKGMQAATAIGTLGLTGAGVYKMIGEK